MQILQSPRERIGLKQRIPLERPMWERILPAVNQSQRKPVTIEESLTLGYRTKRQEIINIQEGGSL